MTNRAGCVATAREEIGVDVVIIGAGLIGLASAYELAKRGASVRVFDVNEPAKAAAWAGAGMLAPHAEGGSSPALETLCAESLAAFPAFVEDLRERSGVDAHLRLNGIMKIVDDEHEALPLRASVAELQSRGIRARWLDRAQARAQEPVLGMGVVGASLVEAEGHIDNRRLGRALAAACASAGVQVTTSIGVSALDADERRVRGVRTLQGFTAAPIVINSAGAWADRLAGVPAFARVGVEPVKGQMLALAMPRALVRRALLLPGGFYAVPRDDGRLLIGATIEHVGFDTRVTAQGMHLLIGAALRALPLLRDFTVVETWAGVRPGSMDGLPFIGATALGGYFVAAGHYRHGILLTPVTARLIADMVEGCAVADYVNAFSPQRPREFHCAVVKEGK